MRRNKRRHFFPSPTGTRIRVPDAFRCRPLSRETVLPEDEEQACSPDRSQGIAIRACDGRTRPLSLHSPRDRPLRARPATSARAASHAPGTAPDAKFAMSLPVRERIRPRTLASQAFDTPHRRIVSLRCMEIAATAEYTGAKISKPESPRPNHRPRSVRAISAYPESEPDSVRQRPDRKPASATTPDLPPPPYAPDSHHRPRDPHPCTSRDRNADRPARAPVHARAWWFLRSAMRPGAGTASSRRNRKRRPPV